MPPVQDVAFDELMRRVQEDLPAVRSGRTCTSAAASCSWSRNP
jgi:hypothetical protein